MVRAAWDSVTAETVVNCFRSGGFSSPSEVMGFLEEDMDLDLQEQEEEEQVSLGFLNLEEGCTCTFKEYVHCDSNLQCAPMLTSQDIVSSATQNPAKDDTDDVSDPLPIFHKPTLPFSTSKHFLFVPQVAVMLELGKGRLNACTQTIITKFFTRSV